MAGRTARKRAGKSNKAGAADTKMTAHAKRILADWTRRHPDRAASERALCKAQAAMHERWGHKRGGTPETLEQAARPGAIARLHLSGAINDDQLAWSTEIFAVAEALGRDVAARIARYDMRVDGAGRAGEHGERLGWVRMEYAYSDWRWRTGHAGRLALDMIVHDRPLTITARAHRMSARRARALLVEALDAWDGCYRMARAVVDEEMVARRALG